MLLAGDARGHVEQVARLLAPDPPRRRRRNAAIAAEFADRSFFGRCGWSHITCTQPAAAGFLHALVSETRACRLTLVHGDYSPKNILVHDGRLILLDHEVIHFGDPAFDLGFSMAHLLSKAHHLPDQRARFAEAARLAWRVYHGAVRDCDWAGAWARAVRHAGLSAGAGGGRSQLSI